MDKNLKVLIIDDSEDDALLILRELRRGGFQPEYERVENALEMRSALQKKDWDLILSDYNMPHFSTKEALSILKESDIDIPFILVSGAIGEENAVQLMKEGAHDYVVKDHLGRLGPVIERELQEARERKSRQIAEKRYRESDFIVNASSDMMALINSDYIYESVNKSFYRAFRKNVGKDIVGYSICEVWGEDIFRNVFKDKFDRCLKGEQIRDELCFSIPAKGRQCFEIVYSPYRDSDGNITHGIVIMHNITNRKMMEQELQQSYQKLQNTLEETVQALSSMVEMRDPYTAGHQKRVAEIAQAIAKRMNLSEEQVESIRIASLLHDVGKICVPADILAKPGHLTKLEFELIKEHSQTGHDILKNIEFSSPIAEIVLQHHERIDGSGYPRGLKGDEILLESRIIGVADVVEAMTYHRPYREALGLDAALAEIQKNRDILFDAEVVDDCTKVFREEKLELSVD